MMDAPSDNPNDDAATNADKRVLFLEISPYEADGGQLIGRHPDQISEAEWHEGYDDLPIGLPVIRAKCLDCAHTPSEVRKCPQADCPLWPFRQKSVPKAYRKARPSQISSRKFSARGLGLEQTEPVEKPAHGAYFEPEDGK